MNTEDTAAATATGVVVVELPLGDAAATFNLEKAVCSHGLFMMAPNHWDPQSKTLQRPLRLNLDPHHEDHEASLMVQISHPIDSPHALRLCVFDTSSLSPQHQHSLLDQVRRMLRLSDEENQRIRNFQEFHEEAKNRGFGRVFRSPTLFEDMVKCILLCNCQWSRTLSMAKALCELQLELQLPLSDESLVNAANEIISGCQTVETNQFVPKTPAGKESKKNPGVHECSINLANRYAEVKEMEKYANLEESCVQMSDCFPPLEGKGVSSCTKIGNFPSPRELASLNEKLLAKRCHLGYRAGRILKLAQEIVEGRIRLRELEDVVGTLSLSEYDKLAEKLKNIDGFGPFTCANVLMCMGFYHVIPTDSETIRHLEQVHAKSSKIRTVQRDVEVIYGKYAPFQFLAYWSEVWQFYEEWFGKLSEMPPSGYKLITAANMRPKRNGDNKRIKVSLENI
ncbi:uncharacterized protein LOC111409797 [Olea europaea var. sylvestris]|uniref:uncharacterized protein LOC111409797 n=1 Tax=Olea europaea var. sylvestris TaxID=158386 RepID=UPI000C1D0FCC|nr:uncharacterized protein LOC111409797 [Olea europaea var. sylvestris]